MGDRLLVIGGGNMASAIVRGAARAGVLDVRDVVVVEPDEQRRGAWSKEGFAAFSGVGRAAADAAWQDGRGGEGGEGGAAHQRVLLAVKPQALLEVARDYQLAVGPVRGGRWPAVISVLAGMTAAAVGAALGGGEVVRVMPNTPAMAGKGITAIARDAPPEEREYARRLFRAVGDVVEIDESLMDAFTAVGGSGPAYVFLLAEAMTRGGLESGLSADMAARVARATVIGAAALLERSDEPPEELRRRVTSKGGTTEAALEVLRAAGFVDATARAILAARDRGRELGGAAGRGG